ncbi:hypothetical protein IFM89_028279 [Coptis chinensis]|uniref:Mediator of RNA polymerase II transcription subunit 18 n=1 Tax=Coptis chinensis TaxID=261450 RepID=A0A835HDR3_9MAGN|nr:hypothetical protein IFM89_028279 [Coptis chinensis]
MESRMECAVEGIIEAQHVEALEILLQGLCGVPKERFRIHELCLKSGPNLVPFWISAKGKYHNRYPMASVSPSLVGHKGLSMTESDARSGSPCEPYLFDEMLHRWKRQMKGIVCTVVCGHGLHLLYGWENGKPKLAVAVSGSGRGSVSSEVRLLCDLEQSGPTWTVRHVGGAMRGAGAEQLSVVVRAMVESKASKNMLRFFYSLGYKLDHELLKVGFSFHFQKSAQLKVSVTSVHKMPKLHAVEEAIPVTPGIQLVEVTAPAAADNYNEVAAAVSSFCFCTCPNRVFLLGLFPAAAAAAAAAASLMSDRGGKNS